MKLVFVPLKDVFKECKGKRQFSIKKDAYRRFSSVSNEMQIGIKKIAALYDAYQKRKHREGKRVHSSTLHYAWAREFGELKGKKHYHLLLLVNRDTWCRAGDYRAPGSLAGMIKQAWCSALGVDAGRYDTLAHFPDKPAVWLERDDETGFQQVLERSGYLAKEHTKARGTGERNFGCSRS